VVILKVFGEVGSCFRGICRWVRVPVASRRKCFETVDVTEHINYWRNGSDEDFAAAESLLSKGHLRHSLFFAHFAIEKMLKAHVTRDTRDIPREHIISYVLQNLPG